MIIRKLRFFELAAVVVTALSTGCAGADGADESVSVSGSEPLVDWDTFRASARAIPERGFLVEGDLLFPTEEALYEYWQKAYTRAPGEALTVHTVPSDDGAVDDKWAFPQNFHLTYCVSNGFTPAQMDQLLPALDGAAHAWSQFLAVDFQRVTVSGTCDQFNAEVVFNVEPADFSASGYPSYDREHRRLYVDSMGPSDIFTIDAQGRDLLGILTHEFGHSLGFVHEHIWRGTCDLPEWNAGDLRANSRQLTAYDQMSVMNYPIENCRDPPGGGYHISPADITGSVRVYGLAPALTTTVTWNYNN